MSVTIIPAQPGWCVVRADNERAPQAQLDEQAILAWQIEIWHGRLGHTTDRPCPITTERIFRPQSAESASQWAIKCPDGTYHIPGQRNFGTDAKACLDYLSKSAGNMQKPARQRWISATHTVVTNSAFQISRFGGAVARYMRTRWTT